MPEPVQPPEPAREEASSRGPSASVWSAYAVLAFVFPLALVVGFFGGRLVGAWLGHPTAGALVGLGLGTLAAFWNLLRVIRDLDRAGKGRAPAGPPGSSPSSLASGPRASEDWQADDWDDGGQDDWDDDGKGAPSP